MVKMTYQMVGPWKSSEDFVRQLPRNLRRKAMTAFESVARKYVSHVKRHLQANDIGLAAKKRPELSNDSRPLLDTHLYLRNIKFWQEQYRIFVGVKKGIYYSDDSGRKEVAAIASLHERGGAKVPKRPVWAITHKQDMGGNAGVRKMIRDKLAAKLLITSTKGAWKIKK